MRGGLTYGSVPGEDGEAQYGGTPFMPACSSEFTPVKFADAPPPMPPLCMEFMDMPGRRERRARGEEAAARGPSLRAAATLEGGIRSPPGRVRDAGVGAATHHQNSHAINQVYVVLLLCFLLK